jgi:hypothetical protein
MHTLGEKAVSKGGALIAKWDKVSENVLILAVPAWTASAKGHM